MNFLKIYLFRSNSGEVSLKVLSISPLQTGSTLLIKRGDYEHDRIPKKLEEMTRKIFSLKKRYVREKTRQKNCSLRGERTQCDTNFKEGKKDLCLEPSFIVIYFLIIILIIYLQLNIIHDIKKSRLLV